MRPCSDASFINLQTSNLSDKENITTAVDLLEKTNPDSKELAETTKLNTRNKNEDKKELINNKLETINYVDDTITFVKNNHHSKYHKKKEVPPSKKKRKNQKLLCKNRKSSQLKVKIKTFGPPGCANKDVDYGI